MKEAFFALIDALTREHRADEVLLLACRGEATDFVRLNHTRYRQAGNLRQTRISFTLIRDGRQANLRFPLSGEHSTDAERARRALGELREQLPLLRRDPHLYFDQQPGDIDLARAAERPTTAEIVESVRRAGDGLDQVGLVSAGQIHRGFASSLGHRYWFEADSFHLDLSLHLGPGQASKIEYAGDRWSEDEWLARMDQARVDLALLARPVHALSPGEYRAYLSPAALREWLVITSDGGFGIKAHRSGQSPLVQMSSQERALSPRVSLAEHPAAGLAPPFNELGFRRPDRLPLIERGRHANFLVGPRSAAEYGMAVTGDEVPDSLDLAAGELATDDVLAELDEGLWISNAWYGNFSDRSRCAITAMTRFACYWVSAGRIVAPIPAMRFDDSLYRVLGEQLIDLTREREFLPDIYTYDGRGTTSYRLPGALLGGLRITL